MHKESVPLPKFKVELTSGKVIAIIVMVCLFFILPVIVINTVSFKQNNSTGQVAGIATDRMNSFVFPEITLDIDLNNQPGVLILAGMILTGIGIIITLFLFIDSSKFKKEISQNRKLHKK